VGHERACGRSSGPTGIVGCYRALWKALERVPHRAAGAGHADRPSRWCSALRQAKLPFATNTVLTLFARICAAALAAGTRGLSGDAIELSCPVLLVIGVSPAGSRSPAGADAHHPDPIYPMNYPDHLLWAAPSLSAVARPGTWSFDGAIRYSVGGGK